MRTAQREISRHENVSIFDFCPGLAFLLGPGDPKRIDRDEKQTEAQELGNNKSMLGNTDTRTSVNFKTREYEWSKLISRFAYRKTCRSVVVLSVF